MFSIFSLKKTYTISELDHRALGDLMRCAIKECKELQWLNDIPWSAVTYRFCPAMTDENNVLGAFSILHPKTVFLQDKSFEQASESRRAYWIEILFPFIVHELRHMWQFRKHPIRFILCSIPGIRALTLECDAVRYETIAEEFSTAYRAARDGEDFIARLNKQKEGDA